MITDFEIPEFTEIMGGNIAFEFAPAHLVSLIAPAIDGSINSPVTFLPGGHFKNGYATPGTLSYTELPESTNHGEIFKISVKGFYPKASAAMINMFSAMLRQKFILVVSEISGEKMLFGTKKEPLAFIYSKSSKNSPGERPGYDFEFSGVVTEATPYYLPA